MGPERDALAALTDAERAHQHRALAWSKIMGREPDPSAAYREAVRAVEAAAKPVVAPDDALLTIGRVIGGLRANPSDFTVILEDATTENVADMAASSGARSWIVMGRSDLETPLTVSKEEADAAVYMAITSSVCSPTGRSSEAESRLSRPRLSASVQAGLGCQP